MVLSYTGTPTSRSSPATRRRVIPFRKGPLQTGVWAAPSLAMNRLAVANSATLPSGSRRIALSKPRAWAPARANPAFGYRADALASVGAVPGSGLRLLDRQAV